MTRPDWESRIRRARELAEQYPAAAEVLGFYAEVAAFQREIFEAAAAEHLHADPMRLRDQLFELFAPSALSRFSALLQLVEKQGPPGLAQAARALRQRNPEEWRSLPKSGFVSDEAQRFFVRACRQPLAEYLALDNRSHVLGYTGSLCPVCTLKPQLSILRPEGDGAKRSLLCSCCATEWDFRRILCPNCAEEDYAKLPRFSADDFPHVRVEACDTCKRYLKSVDLTINGLAVPLVDEIAAASLDLWAAEQGYQKIELNLMGL